MGSQVPRIHVMPDFDGTTGDVAVDFMGEHDMHMDEWQRNIVSDWLAIGSDGKFAASTCGLSVPRQNGKTFVLKCRCYFGICALGETILYTAHEVKTSRKTFEEMAADFDQDNGYPDLAEQVEYIRRANGQEEIKLRDWMDDDGVWHDGGRIIFSARSRGAARGFTADVFVADEAQELTGEQMAALLPTISAGKLQNNQTILIGTPPDTDQNGEIFSSTRSAAISGASNNVCWHEWSVESIGDVNDWSRVEDTNPALDIRLMRSAVQSEMDTMPPDYFARERLGWWSATDAGSVISEREWDACREDEPVTDGVRSYGVRFSADGARVCVSVAVKRDGDVFVELVFDRSVREGLAWLLDWMSARSGDAAMVAVDGLANAQTFTERLVDAGCPRKAAYRLKTGDAVSAYSGMLNAVRERSVRHAGQDELRRSATRTARRDIGGNGSWGFRSTDSADAAPIESASIALWAATHTKRDPSRKMRVG